MVLQSVIDMVYANKYLLALTILVGFFLLARIGLWLSEKVMLRAALKTRTKIDDYLILRTRRPLSWLLLFMGARLALGVLALSPRLHGTTVSIINTIIYFTVGWVVIRVFDVLIDEWIKKFTAKTDSDTDDHMITMLQRIMKVVILSVAILFILQTWGIQIGPLLASLGIAGLAVAFALQSTLANVFGGIALILDKTVKVGDVIQLKDDLSGTVIDVGIRSTKVKTWNNEVVTVPNGKLVDQNVHNLSLPDPRIRVDIFFGVEYGSTIEDVKKLALDICASHKEVLKDPEPAIWFTEMADSALNFKLMFWVESLDKKWKVHQDIITALYDTLNAKGIGIPFPQMDVHVKKE